MLNPVDSKTPMSAIEAKQMKYWRENNIFKRSLELRKEDKKYIFYDGPPFANGKAHYGHILAGSIKDAITRYQSMQGLSVPRINGWDCHGLPVEYEIEKKLNLGGRKDIEEMGIEAFNEACRKSVFTYTEDWDHLFERMGRWVDMEHRYATLDADYMESIWWVFKQIWDKSMIYQGYKAMHICPRCVTPLSNFEVSQAYKEVSDLAITMKFELEEKHGVYLLAWTTTPWSSLTVTGLAVSKEIEYLELETKEGNYILAKNRLEAIFKDKDYKIIDSFKGDALLGKKFKHLFDEFYDTEEVKSADQSYVVVDADYVSDEDGTGIVTINGAFGEVDMESARRHGLPIILNVSMDGHFSDAVSAFAGKYVKGQDHNIAAYLQDKGLLFSKENYRHTYPHCWRCDTPLLNYATKAWFISVKEIKDKLIQNNKKINWQPSHIKDGRFGRWLENVRDWNISRNRFWGCPMPIWECNLCGHKECIDSIKTLKERANSLPLRDGKVDLHRPYIDSIKLPCTKCEGLMVRILEVLDCWFESGAMPYAQLHYPFENKELFEENFPADFIAEGLDQTRGWFYTLHVLATILFDKPAFKNVIVNGTILAADGEKLSKRKKNYPDPEKLFEEKGVDTVRMFLYSSTATMGEDVRFSERHVDELLKKFTLTLWNTYAFFITYARIDRFKPAASHKASEKKLDKWILSRLNGLIKEVTEQMNHYDLSRSTRPIIEFVDDLSNWYVRRSRRRFWKSGSDDDKMQAYQTLYEVLVELSKLIAPFMPFLADEMYQNLTDEDSVHLSDWPSYDDNLISPDLDEEMRLTRTIVNLGHAARAKRKIKVRQPLSKITVGLPHSVNPEVLEEKVILEELNVKSLSILKNAGEIAEFALMPKARLLGPKYGKDVQSIIRDAKAGHFKILDSGQIKVGKFILEKDEVDLAYKGREGYDIESQDGMVVCLDGNLTPELVQEGYARDIIRWIQEMRKEADYDVSDRIQLLIEAEGELKKAMTVFSDMIAKETLADEIKEEADLKWDLKKDFNIDGFRVKIALRSYKK